MKVGFRIIFLCVFFFFFWWLLLFNCSEVFWFYNYAASVWWVCMTRRFSSVLTVLSAGSLFPLHGRESYSWADPRGRRGQRWLWQWWEPNPFCHQENHTAPSPHWPLWGEVKKRGILKSCLNPVSYFCCICCFYRLITRPLRKTSTTSTRSSASWKELKWLS